MRRYLDEDSGVGHSEIIVMGKRSYDVGTQVRALNSVDALRGQDGMRDWMEFV